LIAALKRELRLPLKFLPKGLGRFGSIIAFEPGLNERSQSYELGMLTIVGSIEQSKRCSNDADRIIETSACNLLLNSGFNIGR
jgi:hypothetical protein